MLRHAFLTCPGAPPNSARPSRPWSGGVA
jgi:hypothetical protein